jgi:hypothetical protein
MELLSSVFPDILNDDNDFVRKYEAPDDFMTFNEGDDDMHPIKVDLPKLKDPRKIDGYGLNPDEQVFKYTKMSDKMKKLSKQGGTIQGIWDLISRNKKYYREEILFIKQEWDRVYEGYWCFINGKPTYIPGWHYFYLNYWHLDGGSLPEYRLRDRMFFTFAVFAYTDTTAWFPYRVKNDATDTYRHFSSINEAKRWLKGRSNEIETGDFVIDYGRRTCLGFTYAKHRREGATHKAECVNYLLTFTTKGVHSGIQSMDEQSAWETFRDKLVAPWKRLPFFFKPEYTGSTSPKERLTFDYAPFGSKVGGAIASPKIGLESYIDFKSPVAGAYDGSKLRGYHGDEVGKTKHVDVYRRHNIVQKALMQGNNIVGFAIYTSTVGQMAKEGGSKFKSMCMNSKWEERSDVTGSTSTGLYNLFIPAYINLEGYTDKFGNPIIEDPKTKEEVKKLGTMFGAKTDLNERRRQKENDPEALNDEIRMHPMKYRECFLRSAKNSSFDLTKIHNRLNEFDMNPSIAPRCVNFKWTNGFGSAVIPVDDPDGRFYISYLPEKPNQKIMYNGQFRPVNPFQFRASADPFKTERSSSTRGMSNGGGAVFMMRDPVIDPDDKSVEEWITNRFVCTYNNRTDLKREFAEDMLKMCIYYNALIFPERNVTFVIDMFKEWKYGGYLMYARQKNKKVFEPGFWTSSAVQQEIFMQYRDYISMHSHREMHPELLEELAEIDGYDDMTHYDLFTAGGGCLISLLYDETDKMGYGEDDGVAFESVFYGRSV